MKSKKYRIGVRTRKVYQKLPSGKTILRLEPLDIGANKKGLKNCKWRSKEQIKLDNEKAEKIKD